MFSRAGQRIEESVPEMDSQGAEAEADHVSREQWTGLLELGKPFLPIRRG
jgi:hypothetical protein